MATTIYAPVKFEIRSVNRFFQDKNNTAPKNHRRLCIMYRKHIMSDSAVRKWCRIFREGRIDIHDEGGQRRKSVATDDKVKLSKK